MVLEVDSNNVVEEEVQSPLSLKLNDSSSKIGGTQTMRPQNHSELEDLLLMDCETANRFSPNGTPEPFESECCVGVVLPMIRTSNKTKGNTRNEKVYDYFRSKKRGFEFQFQLKLKKIPEGDFYISCQLSEPLQLNIIKRYDSMLFYWSIYKIEDFLFLLNFHFFVWIEHWLVQY